MRAGSPRRPAGDPQGGRVPVFPTVYATTRGDARLGPLTNALHILRLLGVETPQAHEGATITIPRGRLEEFLAERPTAPGWGFADTTSPTPSLPRIAFPYSHSPIGCCNDATLTSTPDGITLTGVPGAVKALFDDPDDGIVVLTDDGNEHYPTDPDVTRLVRAALSGREHLTVVPANADHTLLPLLRHLSDCPRREKAVNVRVRNDHALLL